MKEIYKQALQGNCFIEETCFDGTKTAQQLDRKYWDKAKKANKQIVTKIAVKLGIIDAQDAKLYNPYLAHKTDTHLIYTHSAQDYFIRVQRW